jgi:hypothetical protein
MYGHSRFSLAYVVGEEVEFFKLVGLISKSCT